MHVYVTRMNANSGLIEHLYFSGCIFCVFLPLCGLAAAVVAAAATHVVLPLVVVVVVVVRVRHLIALMSL